MNEKRWLIVIGVCILVLLVGNLFPAPYNLRYGFKRLFYTPTFICKDDVYSFASTRQGACSGHGGVKRRYQAPENPDDEDPPQRDSRP